MRARTISTLFTALLLAALPSGAFAQDYCVTCTAPDAKYHCVIGGDASVAARSSRGQMLCITQLAQSGGHASCSVNRTTTEPCEGKLRTVMFPPGEANTPPLTEMTPQVAVPETAPPPLPTAPGAPPALTEGAPGAPPPPGPPQQASGTVGEFASKTAKDTGEGIKKAGDAVTNTVDKTGKAIGHAASKTWKCLSSFFGDC
jgi:hypothetical protein